MVETLASDYASQPVLFLEYDVDNTNFYRSGRWWSANGGGTVSLPLVMVDSGNQISNGYEDFDTRYRAMVDASLARPAQAEINATPQRVGDGYHFDVTVKNTSSETLSSGNQATVWAIIYEEPSPTDGLTNRFVRSTSWVGITSLAPGATGNFSLDTMDLSGVVWANLHAVVLVDYQPAGSSGVYDMLQAESINPLP